MSMNEWLIRASGFYLTVDLVDFLIDGPEEELYSFIEDHLLEPMEMYEAANIWKFIEVLACGFKLAAESEAPKEASLTATQLRGMKCGMFATLGNMSEALDYLGRCSSKADIVLGACIFQNTLLESLSKEAEGKLNVS